jgi:predicted AlkP superfamily phosphohydrolase/phosphomutase
VGAVWPSFFTGVSPSRHGRYCYKQIVTGTYAIDRFQPSQLKRPPFWNALSEAGQRVAIVDVPKSPVGTGLNGLQLIDWGTHDPEFGATFRTWPPSLAGEITSKFGSDPVGDCDGIERTAAGYARFSESLMRRIESKTAILCDLVERDGWDLFMAVFGDSHCVGHQCWTLHDTGHPFHDPALATAVGDPVKQIYVALDAAVGRVLQKAGPETTVMILASHGMGPHFDATFMLDQILERLEPPPSQWDRLRISARDYQRRTLRRLLRRRPLRARAVDHLRCFQVPNNDVYGGIRVNLIGREPRGRIRPGNECNALFDELRHELLQLVNLDTGQPVVRDLLRATDLYEGEHLADLPDFLVEWNREAPISRVTSPKIGVLEKRFDGGRNGDHKPEGFFWALGRGIQAGRRVTAVSVMDFAPTIGALLDVTLKEVDGKVIPSVTPAR